MQACVTTETNCCSDSDCNDGLTTNGKQGAPAGSICTIGTGVCDCDTANCELPVSLQGEKTCSQKCDCPGDCDGAGTCNDDPDFYCDPCGVDGACQPGATCDGKYCIPAGDCTDRKNKLCDNAYFLITGSSDQRAKCCPDTSGCVKNKLLLTGNSVCSTTCGDCFGTIQGTAPIALCSFAESTASDDLGFVQCYTDITKAFCEDVANIVVDVGAYKCNTRGNGVVGGTSGCLATGGNDDVCCPDPLTGTYAPASCDPNLAV
jgi:hypothetical protein